jgi:hypothetical protein
MGQHDARDASTHEAPADGFDLVGSSNGASAMIRVWARRLTTAVSAIRRTCDIRQ